MSEIFPEPIRNLPQADIPIEGITSYLLQGENQQVVFMSFDKDVSVPEHSHEAQWGVVLDGESELTIGGNDLPPFFGPAFMRVLHNTSPCLE